MIRETDWSVPDRYTDLKLIGYGSFGVVKSAFDNHTQITVSIKKIENIFRNERKAYEAYREIKVLKFVSHVNLINLIHAFTDDEKQKDVYLVTKFMDFTLYERLYHRKPELDEDYKILYMYQILRGLRYLHKRNIIHRDLKPTNITVTDDVLKIIDFGLAREEKDNMTEDVMTLWYRAPEVILDAGHYNKSVDLFSAGCVLAELLVKRVIFQSRGCKLHHLKLFFEALGPPNEEYLIAKGDDVRTVVEMIISCGNFQVVDNFESNFPELDPEESFIELDLLKKLLTLYPNERIDCDEALRHECLRQYFREEHLREDSMEDIRLFKNPPHEKEHTIERWKEIIRNELRN